MNMKGSGCLIGILLVIILGVMFFNQEPAETPAATADDYKFNVMVACEKLVKENLKSPATMRTPGHNLPVQTRPGVWRYEFPVDAQNSFGALIRSTFRCDVADGHVTVKELP